MTRDTEAQLRKEQPGLGGAAFAEELNKRVQATMGPIIAETNARYIKQFSGRKLSDDELQGIIDTQSEAGADHIRKMAKDRDAAKAKEREARMDKISLMVVVICLAGARRLGEPWSSIGRQRV